MRDAQPAARTNSCPCCLNTTGHVITNYHVITDASDIQVTFMGGAEYSAKVIGVDQDKDVAVLEVRAGVHKRGRGGVSLGWYLCYHDGWEGHGAGDCRC